jgi:hypothetical protein
VFAGRVAFDPKVEQLWIVKGDELCWRAIEMLAYGDQAELPCYILDGKAALRSALYELNRLLSTWVTPKLAVGPAARQRLNLSPAANDELRPRIAALPPLPAD